MRGIAAESEKIAQPESFPRIEVVEVDALAEETFRSSRGAAQELAGAVLVSLNHSLTCSIYCKLAKKGKVFKD
jgi:hypothetical protein